MLDDESLSETVEFGRDEPQSFSVAADRDEPETPRLRFRRHAPPGFAIDIDDRGGAFRQKLGEQPELLREIVLEARVIVQMIARDIGESAGGERDAVDAALLQP